MPHSLTWLPTVLTGAGLKVSEVPGWPNRGAGGRDVGPIKGVICHHTAGGRNGNMPSLRVITEGRADLPGPLSQLGLGRDGTFFVVAAGRANHAGRGDWRNQTDGNTSFIGIEAENTGFFHPTDRLFDPWPDVQVDAYQRGVAAILKHLRLEPMMCCAHREYALPSGRKPDPHTLNMDDFRQRVRDLMRGAAPPPVLIPRTDAEGRPTLRRRGPTNPEFLVKELQRKLGIAGDRVDGVFGPMTEAAVRQFQREQGLVPDGIVGPRTWELLNRN
ncbi:MAG: N-acetylmuramoyl-L-alanine amidase [Novosphingobium sp.]